jgi:glycosyltransferase involved in cell wall biosynthesis
MTMRVGFYSRTLKTGGGGEKYLLSMAEAARAAGAEEIRILSPEPPDLAAWRRLSVDLPQGSYRWRRATDQTITIHTMGLDVFICMTFFRAPVSLAKRSIAVIQFPEVDLHAPLASRTPSQAIKRVRSKLRNRVLSGYEIVCYSQFVQQHISERLGRHDATVIYPPFTAIPRRSSRPKLPWILATGRFINTKRQDAMIEAFRKLYTNVPAARGWELHLAGLSMRNLPPSYGMGEPYIESLRSLAQDLPVTFHLDIGAEEMRDLYAQASIFWQAAGYQMDSNPAFQEHFGITTVEALDGGAVPIVTALGGQPEIVEHGVNGFLWSRESELIAYSESLMNDSITLKRLAAAGIDSASKFDMERFHREVVMQLHADATRSRNCLPR